ncbi:MAG: diacylglycerol kinase, partial [Planctomycetota bacterium]
MSGPVRRWSSKFGVAIAGMAWAFRTQSSFYIHLPVAVCVIVAAILSGIDALRVAVLVAAIGLVLTA